MKELIASLISIASQFALIEISANCSPELKELGVNVDRLFTDTYAVRMNDVQVIYGVRSKPYITFFDPDQIQQKVLEDLIQKYSETLALINSKPLAA